VKEERFHGAQRAAQSLVAPSAVRDIARASRPDRSDPPFGGRSLAVVLAAFAAVALLAGLDLALDLREGTTFLHLTVEGAAFAVGTAGAVTMGRALLRTRRRARELDARLEATQREAARWRAEAEEHLRGLAAAIDQQLDRWGLSPAEKEVALLLLKGLSHKEIAGVRSISEATARQQARAVYKKAGLTGRSDLAAFFLEDLLVRT
jgi:DNA-binding NarL/FixJ family response regulator